MPLTRVEQVGLGLLTLLGAQAPQKKTAGCDASSAHATSFLANAQSTFPRLDSAGAARLGWRAAPKTMSLVTAPAKCDAIVNAHNAYVSKGNAAFRLTSAAIIQADGTYLVEVPGGTAAVPERLIFVYDTALKFRVVY